MQLVANVRHHTNPLDSMTLQSKVLRAMDSKEELLDRLQCELEAMRERAEMAKHLATSSPTHDGFLVEHAANIERATVSLEAIIKDIRNAWKDSKTSEAEMPQPRHAFEIVNTNSPNPAYRKSKIA